MSDQDHDPQAEAYHVLGAVRYQMDQVKQQLDEQIHMISEKGRDLEKQLDEAERLNDGEAVERITTAIEDLHRAYALARDELDQHGGDDATGGGREREEASEDTRPTTPSTGQPDAESPAAPTAPASEGDQGEEPESAADAPPTVDAADTDDANAASPAAEPPAPTDTDADERETRRRQP